MADTMPQIPRHIGDPGRHYFLLGPRGTGKTTWLRRCYPDALFVDLLLPDRQRRFAARPEHLIELVAGQKTGGVVVVDEIQRVPPLLDVVHALIEERPEHRFVLTGSSARKLRRAGTDLLGGRAALRTMHPFTASELGPGFDFERALEIGLVPLVWAAPQPRDVLEGYAELYLREEVQMEGMVRRLGSFARFLEAVSFSQACPINLSEVARECEVPRKTAQGYLEILEDLLLCFRVPAFTRRAKRRLAAHPKFFFFDVGVYRALRPAGPARLDRLRLARHLPLHLAHARGQRGRLRGLRPGRLLGAGGQARRTRAPKRPARPGRLRRRPPRGPDRTALPRPRAPRDRRDSLPAL
jgi:predicted AAA+ superfamily ATPase